MEAILNFGESFDVSLFERVVRTFFEGTGSEQQKAQKIITQFQEHPDSWTKVDSILEHSGSLQAKFIALQILEKLVQARWNALPREQCLGIRNYIVSLIIKHTSNEANLSKESVFINKLNVVLVQILKYEWPKHWPTFITELISSSQTGLGLCENNMAILKLLSEEIFDFSADQMTTVRAKNMKQQFCGEFSSIFELISKVLERANKPSLIKATLESLIRFLRWIPFGYIFETDLIDKLKDRFLPVQQFRALTVSCLTEIVSQDVSSEYLPKIEFIFRCVLENIQKVFPLTPTLDFAAIFNIPSGEMQVFIQNLSLFFTTCMEKHLSYLEAKGNRSDVISAHFYLIKISMVDDKEIFKVCLEYWNKLVCDLFKEFPFGNGSGQQFGESPLLLGPLVQTNSRRAMYAEVMSQLRHVMINKMVKPEEVLIVQDENGDIIRETQKESDTLAIYTSMKEVLVYLTHLDYEDMEEIMRTKLEYLFDPAHWNFDNINKLCWAIGSISGAMVESAEKSFLVFVISKLLSLCESKKGKSNKAIVAANVMYVVGQYPRFLKSYWKFLKTVLNKLFEFMHETHEGVQDMACETFLKVCQRCKKQICTSQLPDEKPFIEEIIERTPSITDGLTDSQKQIFYEAKASVISSESDPQRMNVSIEKMMFSLNMEWSALIQSVASNIDTLVVSESYKKLSHILRCNNAACSAIRTGYSQQMAKIYMDMLSLYRTCSSIISSQVATQGIVAARTTQMKGLRTIKKDILRFIDTFINKIDNPQSLANDFVPPLFDAILNDYNQNVEPARDAEVLNVTTSAFNKFGPLLSSSVSAVLDSVLECTLHMISRDFTEFPEHRQGFFRLLASICSNCFPALLSLSDVYFKLYMDSIIWAFKHTMRDIAEIGLTICQDLLGKIIAQPNSAFTAQFFQKFYLSLMQDVFFVLTDSSQKSGFKYQAEILSFLFNILTKGILNVPLSPSIHSPSENIAYVRNWLVEMLRSGFPNLQPQQIDTFVQGLFELSGDVTLFKSHLRDFLIQSKEFAKDDPDLFREEFELVQQRKLDAEKDVVSKVPGLAKVNDDDE